MHTYYMQTIHTYIHKCIHTYMQTIHAYIHTCTHTYIHTCIHTSIYNKHDIVIYTCNLYTHVTSRMLVLCLFYCILFNCIPMVANAYLNIPGES